MGLSFPRLVMRVIALSITLSAVPAYTAARDLATAQGTISISEARPGLQAPTCAQLVVEARDALDNHLIAETQPTTDEGGACRYVLSVPAQSAIWLRVQPLLVAATRVIKGLDANPVGPRHARPSSGSVALRFTIIARATYFFDPNEQKMVPLSY